VSREDTNRKKMHVLWVQDFDIWHQAGGAEASDRTTVIEGIRRGHTFRFQQLDLNMNIMGCDVAVVSNFSRYPPDIIARLVDNIPTVFYLHDYLGACSWRLHYPLAERCLTRCPVSAFPKNVMTKAKLLVWLSPLHREAWLKKHPELKDLPHHLHPSPVEPGPFEEAAKNPKREPGSVVGINVLNSFKGRDNCLDYAKAHPELKFMFIGGPDQDVTLPGNCRAMSGIASDQVPWMLAQTEYLIHLPQSPEPFGRVIPEAVFSGCKLIVNDRIGALSYGWKTKEEMRKALTESPSKFWERVEGLLG